MIDGFKIIKNENYTLVVIEDFSEKLKNSIRKNLSIICNGEKLANMGKDNYCYKKTVNIFFNERLKPKTDDQKMGQMAEMIVHLLIIEEIGEFITVSPFFNLETNHPKHGFDLINYKTQQGDVWLTEVKSGKKQAGTSDESINILLKRANDNLRNRLEENKNVLWRNAIYSVNAAIDNHRNIKDAIISILEEYDIAAYENKIETSEINAILAGCLFAEIEDEISEENIQNEYNNELGKGVFRDIYLIAIQKNTFEKIYEFLESEANDE